MEKQKVKKASKQDLREYNKALLEITRLQAQLERAECKARQYIRQIYN